MEKLFGVLGVSAHVFACFSCYYCFFGLKGKTNYRIYRILFSFLMAIGVYFWQNYMTIKIWQFIPIAFLWCMIQIEGSYPDKIKIFLLEITAFPIVGNLVLYGSRLIFGRGFSNFEEELMADILISVLLWLKYLFSKEMLRIRELKISVYLILIFLMLFSAFMVSGCSYIFTRYISGFACILLLFIVSGTGFMICLMAGMIFYIIHRNQEYNILLKEQEKSQEFQKQYYLRLLEKENDTRSFRHDIANHMLAIYEKVDAGKNEEACQYIDKLQGQLHKIQKKNYDVGNDLINAILNYYFAEEERRVTISGYLRKPIPIEETDLCIIVSNLVKNMVQHADWQEKASLRFRQGEQSFVIEACNVAKGEVTIDKATGLPKTTKQDKRNHGYGLWNMKSMVEKHHGNMEFQVQEKRVQIKITFNFIDR